MKTFTIIEIYLYKPDEQMYSLFFMLKKIKTKKITKLEQELMKLKFVKKAKFNVVHDDCYMLYFN